LNEGYALMEPLQLDIVFKGLGQSLFSKNLIFVETVDSTNNMAKDLAAKGAQEGTVVVAEEQTAGRGRLQRKWLSPKHANLLFSVLLRPSTIVPDQIFTLTMILALASIDAVEDVSGIHIMIKWPNDLYVNQKKLGGILTEFSVRKNLVQHVVLGLGLNVNWEPADSSLLYPSTSILTETGGAVSREQILIRILKKFERYYYQILAGKLDNFYERWNRRSMLFGKRITIQGPGESRDGIARGIDKNGALVITNDKGKEERVMCGDISVKLHS